MAAGMAIMGFGGGAIIGAPLKDALLIAFLPAAGVSRARDRVRS